MLTVSKPQKIDIACVELIVYHVVCASHRIAVLLTLMAEAFGREFIHNSALNYYHTKQQRTPPPSSPSSPPLYINETYLIIDLR